MSDVFNSQNPSMNSQGSDISILKYFEDVKLGEKAKGMITHWRKNEKPLAWIVRIALFALLGWGIIAIAPILLSTLSALAASASIVGAGFVLWSIRKPLYKIFRNFVRGFHKLAIKWSPFLEFDDAIQKKLISLDSFRKNKANLKGIRNDFQQMSLNAEAEAKNFLEIFQQNKLRAASLKEDIDEAIKDPNFKETDTYAKLMVEWNNATAAANRAARNVESNNAWKSKYASRANILAKLDRRLMIKESQIENEIQDFQSNVDMLKKEWAMADTLNRAMAALMAILGQKGENWETEYAFDVVLSKINEDIAMTAQSLEYLERNTGSFDFDSDEAYKKLDEIAEKLAKEEANSTPASKIANPFHELTPEERKSAGSIGNIFK